MTGNDANALVREGVVRQQRGDHAAAAECFARARAVAPQSFDGWHHGGMTALLAGQAADAVPLLTRALELKPKSVPTALGLGVAHVACGQAAAAEPALRRVVREQPKLADAWHYLALAIESQGRFDEAIEARQQVTKLDPKFAPGWTALGALLSSIGRQGEALRCFTKARQLVPGDSEARLGYAMALGKCHRVPEAAAEYAAVVRSNPQRLDARSFRLMALHNLAGLSPAEIFAEHVEFGRAAGVAVPRRWPNLPVPGRRLRVGWLSPDLREHSVAYFLEPLLRHLDPAAFEVILYHDSPQEDAVSQRLRGYAAAWRNVAGRTDEMVEAAIQADQPDVLVDLAGHSGASRLRLFARRQAPVQITYLGYPDTTGVAAMDYRFVDEHTDPAPGADRWATEQLVRFAPTLWAYQPPVVAPVVSPPPCLASGRVTFGAFNNFTKVTDETLRVWARLLEAVPGSRLCLKGEGLGDPAILAPVRLRLRQAGLSDDRVEVLGRTPDTASHLALYAGIDVALDTFPYNGTTTTCEALWMGVPVVAVAGDRHCARVSESLLTAVGHPEWIAPNPDAYVALAAALARAPGQLAELRTRLRAEMQASPLLDHVGQAARFGAALRACWLRWCEPAVRPPADVVSPLSPLVASS
jgi:predicted O-linked N-acetylglucosamine transferase (SPINDLY family)